MQISGLDSSFLHLPLDSWWRSIVPFTSALQSKCHPLFLMQHNNNIYVNVYGAVIMTIATIRAHVVHLMNAVPGGWRCPNQFTNPGCECSSQMQPHSKNQLDLLNHFSIIYLRTHKFLRCLTFRPKVIWRSTTKNLVDWLNMIKRCFNRHYNTMNLQFYIWFFTCDIIILLFLLICLLEPFDTFAGHSFAWLHKTNTTRFQLFTNHKITADTHLNIRP